MIDTFLALFGPFLMMHVSFPPPTKMSYNSAVRQARDQLEWLKYMWSTRASTSQKVRKVSVKLTQHLKEFNYPFTRKRSSIHGGPILRLGKWHCHKTNIRFNQVLENQYPLYVTLPCFSSTALARVLYRFRKQICQGSRFTRNEVRKFTSEKSITDEYHRAWLKKGR